MNLQGILFGSPPTLSLGTSEVILGPILSESKSGTATVSNHAVERDYVSDHVHNQPDQFSIKTILADQNDLLAAASDAAKAALRFKADTLSVKDKIEKLDTWKSNGELLKYSGPVFSGMGFKGYDMTVSDVVITKLDVARSSSTGSGVEVSISLQKVKIAEVLLKELKLAQAAKSTKKAGQSETGKETAPAAKPKSIFAKWFGG